MQLNKLLHYLACFIFFSLLFFLFIIKDLANLKPGSAPNGATSRTNYICSFLLLENLVSGTVCVCLCRLKIYLYTLSSRNYPDLTSTQRHHSHLFTSLPLLFAKLSKQSFPIQSHSMALSSAIIAIHAFTILFLVSIIFIGFRFIHHVHARNTKTSVSHSSSSPHDSFLILFPLLFFSCFFFF